MISNVPAPWPPFPWLRVAVVIDNGPPETVTLTPPAGLPPATTTFPAIVPLPMARSTASPLNCCAADSETLSVWLP